MDHIKLQKRRRIGNGGMIYACGHVIMEALWASIVSVFSGNNKALAVRVIRMSFTAASSRASGKLLRMLGACVGWCVGMRRTEIAGVHCRELGCKPIDAQATLVFAHGGGYVLGHPSMYGIALRTLTKRHLRRGWRVISVDYGLAPTHPHPEGMNDVLAVVQHILHNGGRVALMGDSAGGGIALAVARRVAANNAVPHKSGGLAPTEMSRKVAARDAGASLSRQSNIDALVLISPWVRHSVVPRTRTNVHGDDDNDYLHPNFTDSFSRAVTCNSSFSASEIRDLSPLSFTDTDYSTLPRTCVVYGNCELFADDARELVTRMSEQGLPVRLPLLHHSLP